MKKILLMMLISISILGNDLFKYTVFVKNEEVHFLQNDGRLEINLNELPQSEMFVLVDIEGLRQINKWKLLANKTYFCDDETIIETETIEKIVYIEKHSFMEKALFSLGLLFVGFIGGYAFNFYKD